MYNQQGPQYQQGQYQQQGNYQQGQQYQQGYQQQGGQYNQGGYNEQGYNQQQQGYNQYGQNQGYNQGGYQQGGYNQHPNQAAYQQNTNQNNFQMNEYQRNDYENGGKKNKKNKTHDNQGNQKKGFYAKLVNTDLSGTIFEDKDIRRKFVRKVLTIIACQFALTAFLCLGAVFSESYRKFQFNNYWLLILCWIISLACMITLYCFREQARKVPRNYWLLGIFTAAESYMVSYICAFTAPGVVLMATGITTLLVFGLVIYAVKTKNDITQKANLLMYAGFAVLALVIVGIFFTSKLLHTIIALALILLFSAYLVFDIQRLQGNRAISYDIDDYIIAALDIYIDIIVIFKQVLYLLGANRQC